MPDIMNVAVLHGKNDIRLEKVEIPEISKHEVLLRVKATGICGSDLPRVLGDEAHYYPIVLGHEFAGVVEKVGSSVTRVKPGDRIAGAPLLPCHQCDSCRMGLFAQCISYSFIGSRTNGSWAQYVKLPEMNAVPIPDHVTHEEAALFEPSTVALHALRLIRYEGGTDVAVLGGGNIGLLVLQWAKILGARSVTVFDIDNARLETARKLGADFTLNSGSEGALEEAKRITRGKGFDVVMETAGAPAAMQLSFELAAVRARICFVGTPTRDLVFPYKLFEMMNRKEFTLTGSWMSYSAPYPGKEWELTAQFAASGRLNLKDVVMHQFNLEQINDAFELYRTPGGIKGKVLFTVD